MIFKNNNKIANIYRGTLKVSNVYRGGILVYTGEKSYDCLTFEALEPSTIKYKPSSVSTAQYSYDTVNWNSADNVILNLNTGDKVYFKGNITGNQGEYNYAKFIMTGKVAASGSIMSLQAGNPEDKSLIYNYEFYYMFDTCNSLVTAPALPATTLTNSCYGKMFFQCSRLITAPELPATTLAERCYYSMFNSCISLTTAPELPATTLAKSCYSNMFNYCKSLVNAPVLPATTLATFCYEQMFFECISLTTAPDLPATRLVSYCYKSMFNNCSNLNYIKALFTTTPSNAYTDNWVKCVAATGTFVKNKDATWDVTGVSGIPTGWTVETA